MKDITSTSFGLIIAFILPGMAFLYSLIFWSQAVDQMFKTFLTTQSNVGLFLLVFAAAVILSLQITLVRWLIYEFWICRSYCLDQSFFKRLGLNNERLAAYRAVVDEHYRYHQFWGGLTVVIPFFGVGWIYKAWSNLSVLQVVLAITCIVLIELLTGWAAIVAYKLYSTRAQEILAGGD